MTFRSDIEEFTSTQAENCSDVYEQNRSFTMQLSSGDSFLYCEYIPVPNIVKSYNNYNCLHIILNIRCTFKGYHCNCILGNI